MATIVPLSAIDPALVEELLDAAFGDGRHARTAYRIREGMDWLEALSFAALDDEDYLVGTIQLWPVALTDPKGRAHPMIMVGPVAVMPGRQGEGFGKALMAASLGAIDAGFDDGAAPRSRLLRSLGLPRRSHAGLALPRPVRETPPASTQRQSGDPARRRHAGPVDGNSGLNPPSRLYRQAIE